ncbi:hypothetical protein [Pseudogemmobacter sonorensis]|uniref:hypothetical protein n=1 Tax=Pseudogemmobacter sonorensis TaxID=2989681 RepID=UPI00367412AF
MLYGADAEVAAWIAGRIPGYRPESDTRALGVIKDGDLVAGVTYERWNGLHCEVSIAALPGSAWADRRTLFALFHFPFVQLGCEAITVLVPMTNLLSLNLATKLGFERQAIIPFAARDGSPLIVLQQFRGRCRWLGYGQGKQQRARGAGSV